MADFKDKFPTGISGLEVEWVDIEDIGYNSDTLLDCDMEELAELLGKVILAEKPDFDWTQDSALYWSELENICVERYHLQPYWVEF